MTVQSARSVKLSVYDDATRALVRLSAIVTVGGEREVREALADAVITVPPVWVEELLLQTYLFAGFPRALNAMREWRRGHPEISAPEKSPDERGARAAGEATCAIVYGDMYERLRANVRALHPLLDDRMIVSGYGTMLSRPGLDLARRELCVIAACAAAAQDRQLHSHLHGALNAGASASVIDETIQTVTADLPKQRAASVRMLWDRVKGK